MQANKTEVIRNLSKRNRDKAEIFVSGFNGPEIFGVVNPERLGGKKKLKAEKEKNISFPAIVSRKPKTNLKGARFAKGEIVKYNGDKFAIVSISKVFNEFRYAIRLLGGIREIGNVSGKLLTKGSEKLSKGSDIANEFPINPRIK